MKTRHNPLYQLLDRDYHESFDFYIPRCEDFRDRVLSKLPAQWQVRRHGMWFHCGADGNKLPEQGWKIHISATRTNAEDVIERVSSILFAAGDSDFKFALDLPTLFLLNSKNWPRSASGKFITIYPPNDGRFLHLIEELYLALRDFQGPYILSDRPYKDSRVVFYRYGGMRLCEDLEVTGERTPVLTGPGGEKVPDRRMAYPVTPAWAKMAVSTDEQDDISQSPCLLGEGRFEITSVIEFSSAGGVYRGKDHRTGADVVIKEARPCIEVSGSHDAVTLLKKEYRLLNMLADTGIAPRPIELFQEETHWFLAEEYIPGVSMGAHSASHNVLLRTRPSERDYQVWYGTFRMLALRLIEIVGILHSRNIVFSDLSTSNLIVTEAGNDLKLIDFEAAYQVGVDQPINLYTTGFAAQRRVNGAVADSDDDYYAVGAVLMAYLLPVNGLFHLKAEAKEEFMASVQADARLPKSVADMILALMRPGAEASSALVNFAEMLPPECAPAMPARGSAQAQDYGCVLDSILQHLLQSADYERRDRLFPADPKVFVTNPLSVAYGATGIAYTFKKLTGSVPQPIIDWILARPIHTDCYAPGLYSGLAGIAWVLLECGERSRAEQIFQLASRHRLQGRSVDLFYGSAGWGLTGLRFFLDTGNELYLDEAIRCANPLLDLIRSEISSRDGKAQTDRPLGMAHGASGIALFLLYLYLVTREEHFLAAGREALEAELGAGIQTMDGGLSWGAAGNSQSILYPYWRYGSAGVGVAVVRYHKILGDDVYREALESIFIDTDRDYSVLPGRFMGLAGSGDFMLDAWEFTGNRKYLDRAHKVAAGLLKFGVSRQGLVFPGDFLNRLSCDYGTGSAGIALFLNRLLSRQGADFLLDCLLSPSERQPGDVSSKNFGRVPASLAA